MTTPTVRPDAVATAARGEREAGDPSPSDGGAPDRSRAPSRLMRAVHALLRVPLFYKILIANAAMILISTALGGLLSARILVGPGQENEFLILLVVAAVAASILVNALILRVALAPLEELGRTAARITSGDMDARAPSSPVTDLRLRGLIHTFNGMLDRVTIYRRRLRRIAIRALEAAEEERKRIARELHDDTAQVLTGLLLRVKMVRRADSAEERDVQLDALRRELTEATEGVRRFARGLRPPALDMIGLVAALEGQARTTAETTGLRIRVDADEDPGPLDPEAELALYRIVQEALSNAVKHARSDTARITLRREGDRVVTTVEDDGRGFDVDRMLRQEQPGLGLFGMQERAAYIGGRLTIDSEPGTGTRVTLEIPIGKRDDDV